VPAYPACPGKKAVKVVVVVVAVAVAVAVAVVVIILHYKAACISEFRNWTVLRNILIVQHYGGVTLFYINIIKRAGHI